MQCTKNSHYFFLSHAGTTLLENLFLRVFYHLKVDTKFLHLSLESRKIFLLGKIHLYYHYVSHVLLEYK